MTKAELQRLRALRDKKHREAEGLFVVEGEKVVAELLAARFPFVALYATPDWDGFPASRPAAESPAVVRITPTEMARASHFPTPSRVLAVGRISRPELSVDSLERGRTLALDGVQDAGNVGTMLRIADWFGFDHVLLSPDCADLFHQKVINASMGSFARVRAHTMELGRTLAAFAARGTATPIIGCDLEGEDVHGLPAMTDAIVVIGSEGRGLSREVAAQLTRRVTIPRYGHAESLNAAIAAAIVCDTLRRPR